MTDQRARLPEDARIGRVRLRIADLGHALAFYRDVLGLDPLGGSGGGDGEGDGGALAAAGSDEPLVRLVESRDAGPRPRRSTGLYHFAILLPNRLALARAFARLHTADWPVQGASDHAVSEAIYLADPDGNGIELYADRPREEWPRRGGEIAMTTEALDLRGLLAELESGGELTGGVPAGTVIGHVHLHVPDLEEAEAFYRGLLGLDVTARGYPGALFMSAGGYHHHVGVNVWAGRGAPRPPDNAVGLIDFALIVPGDTARAVLLERLAAAGVEAEEVDDGHRIEDPAGNGIVIAARDLGRAATS